MSDLFVEAVRQFGLPVGLLLVAVVTLARVVVAQYRESKAQYDRDISELRAEVKYWRDRCLEALDAAEVGQEAATRLAAGRKRRGGGS